MTERSNKPYGEWIKGGQRVVAREASSRRPHAEGTAISYTDRPMLGIRLDDGTIIDWVADLCDPVEPLCRADCSWHGDEPVPEKYFRLCIECGHVFVTREELIESHRVAAEAAGIDPQHPNLDTFCGLCLHDFAFGERS